MLQLLQLSQVLPLLVVNDGHFQLITQSFHFCTNTVAKTPASLALVLTI